MYRVNRISTACNYEQTIGTSWTETNNASMSIDAGIEAAMSAGNGNGTKFLD